jgi:hypothetical protein
MKVDKDGVTATEFIVGDTKIKAAIDALKVQDGLHDEAISNLNTKITTDVSTVKTELTAAIGAAKTELN